MHISFDCNLQRWMVGVWYCRLVTHLEILVDIGPFEWLIYIPRSK